MLERAKKFSLYATFNDPNKVAQSLIALRDSSKVLGFRPGKYVVPFVRTPANILTRGVEYSPLGLAKLAKTGLKSAEASEVVARSVIGSLAMLGFTGLAASGRITGAPPSEKNARDAFYRQGKQPFSVKIGNRWVQYNQTTGPISLTLAATAAFHDSFNRSGNVPTEERVAEAAAVIGRSIVDSSFLRGVHNLIDALTDPKAKAGQFVADTASGFVPFSGLQRNIANAIDPEVKDPEGLYERILTGIPLASKRVEPKLDVMGRTSEMEGGSGLAAFLPTRIPKDEPKSDVDAELNRLGIFPGETGKTITVSDQRFDLDREQARELQRVVGLMQHKALAALFASPGYQSASDEDKQKTAQELIDLARQAGRRAFVMRTVRAGGKFAPATKSIPGALTE
jgi:hypothetical protein